MSLKAIFLKLPINLQIYISLLFMILVTFGLILLLSLIFASNHIQYLLLSKKEYFLIMQKNIIESNIIFMQLSLYQYENLIKVFNYQIYLYLKDEEILKEFTIINNNKEIDENKIYIIKNPATDDLPDYKPSDEPKLYVYSYSPEQSVIISLISSHYLSFVNQIKGIRNFRIPFYGNLTLAGEFLISFIKYNTFITLNNSRIKEIYNSVNGDMNKYFQNIKNIQQEDINFYKRFFNDYENNQIYFLDLMYKLKYPVFFNYSEISDINNKEEYLKNQSIFFQNILFENGTYWFFDKWNTENARFQGKNNIIFNFLDFLLLHLSSKMDIFSIPLNHVQYYVISKKLCYFILFKQIIYFNITSDKNDGKFNQDYINKIYDEIFKKDKIYLEDCKLETYLKKNNEIQNDISNNFYSYFDVKYIFNTYIYLLRNKDDNSLIFGTKSTYPNYLFLKDCYPNFFSFQQIDFFSFSFGYETIRIFSSNNFLNNITYLMCLCIIYLWFFLIFIFIVISSRAVIKVTEPIIKLTEFIDLSHINEKNINEEIFEYKLDEEINKFFLKCKNLINGETNECLYKNKENKEISSNKNNNMIINNKMILELIENQKNLNNDDKEIVVLKQPYSEENERYVRHRTNKSSKLFNIENNLKGVNNCDLIKLTNANNDNDDNKLINSSEEIYSELEEKDPELENMKYYENLLNLSDYLYNGRDKEKNNYQNKLRMNIYHTSTNTNFHKLGSVSNISVSDKSNNEIKNIRKDCKYITYYWYINAKKNKSFGNN